jgi:predicted hydrocarbon binding protein
MSMAPIVKPEELPLHCEGNIGDYEEALHGIMVLNAMIIRSLEEIARGGANAVVYRAGMKMGHETAKYFPKTDNVEKALKELSEILGRQYNFELWKPKGKDSYIIT